MQSGSVHRRMPLAGTHDEDAVIGVYIEWQHTTAGVRCCQLNRVRNAHFIQ